MALVVALGGVGEGDVARVGCEVDGVATIGRLHFDGGVGAFPVARVSSVVAVAGRTRTLKMIWVGSGPPRIMAVRMALIGAS